MAIDSFKDLIAKEFFEEGTLKKHVSWASVKSIVKRKLDMIHYASTLTDLRSPPGNKLEPLRGDLEGFYSIRVNDKWRIIFKWNKVKNCAENVKVCDYH